MLRPVWRGRGTGMGAGVAQDQGRRTGHSARATIFLRPQWRCPPWAGALLPMAACLLVFQQAFRCWFLQDDFNCLRVEIHGWQDLVRLFTVPRAQGILRPFSEDLFFVTFRHLFGWQAYAYKTWIFLTQLANLALLWRLGRRLTEAAPAAMLAPLVWGVNLALATPLAWTCAYSQVLGAFVYLASFLLFLRHVETGRWGFYAAQWGTFLFGFGVLETVVVYPVVALAYCALAARKHAWKAALLFVPSAVFAGLHLFLIPRPGAGPYQMHFDLRMLSGLWDYWLAALGPVRFAAAAGWGGAAGVAGALLLTAGLAAAAWRATPGQRRAALFGVVWFVAALLPVLPFPAHRLDYYLTTPAIGLGLLAAALAPRVPCAAAMAWLAVYAVCSAGYARQAVEFLYERGETARHLIAAVREVRQREPDKLILLTGVDDSVFYSVVYDRGFLAAGIPEVALAPSGNTIHDLAGYLPAASFRHPASATLSALDQDRAVVYRLAGKRLQNVSRYYRYVEAARLASEPQRRVDAGLPELAHQLGPGWYAPGEHHRWMGRRAEVRLAGPRTREERLRVQAWYAQQWNPGPIALTVSVDGRPVGRALVRDPATARQEFALPPEAVGKRAITVTLETDRTFRAPPDPRELGLAFGVIEVVEAPGSAMLQ